MDHDTKTTILQIHLLELTYKLEFTRSTYPGSPELAQIQAAIDRTRAEIDDRTARAYEIRMEELREEAERRSKKPNTATEICDVLTIDKSRFPEIYRFFSELRINEQGKCIWPSIYGDATGLAYVLERLFGKNNPIIRTVPQRWKSFAPLFADENGEAISNAELSKRAEKLRGSTPERQAPSGALEIVERWQSQENPRKSP